MKKISLICSLFLSACASTDPLEPVNRVVFDFNQFMDQYVVVPIAKGYQWLTPEPVDRGITHFFDNLENVNIAISNVLQLKIEDAINDVGRFTVNSTLGLFGFIDVATELGIPQHEEDLGQAFGYWGIPTGPYLVLPLLGPSNFRDGLGLWGDVLINPVNRRIDPPSASWATYGLWYIDNRADALGQEKILQSASFDPYTYLRDAYLQRRQFLVNDGLEADDFFDELIEEK